MHYPGTGFIAIINYSSIFGTENNVAITFQLLTENNLDILTANGNQILLEMSS
jgi:hypothetical protein